LAPLAVMLADGAAADQCSTSLRQSTN
jgi:hypothetical protein